MKKSSSILGTLGVVAGVHALQNAAADRLIKNKTFSKHFGSHLARSFRHGTEGVTKTLPIHLSAAYGATIPEIPALVQEANHLGKKVGAPLNARQALILHHLSRGNMDTTKRLLQKDHGPAVDLLLHHAKMSRQGLLNSSKEGLDAAGRVIKHAPILNPVRAATEKSALRAIGKETIKASRGGATAALVGSAASGLADHAAGAVNAAKSIYAHPALAKVPGISHAKKFIDKIYTSDMKKAVNTGLDGAMTRFRAVRGLGINSLAEHANNLGNDVARALATGQDGLNKKANALSRALQRNELGEKALQLLHKQHYIRPMKTYAEGMRRGNENLLQKSPGWKHLHHNSDKYLAEFDTKTIFTPKSSISPEDPLSEEKKYIHQFGLRHELNEAKESSKRPGVVSQFFNREGKQKGEHANLAVIGRESNELSKLPHSKMKRYFKAIRSISQEAETPAWKESGAPSYGSAIDPKTLKKLRLSKGVETSRTFVGDSSGNVHIKTVESHSAT